MKENDINSLEHTRWRFIAATSLKDFATYPPYRFHLLVGDRKGEWSVSLGNTGYRITLIPCNNQTMITSFKRADDTGIMTEQEAADFVILELIGEGDKSRELAEKLAIKAVRRVC